MKRHLLAAPAIAIPMLLSPLATGIAHAGEQTCYFDNDTSADRTCYSMPEDVTTVTTNAKGQEVVTHVHRERIRRTTSGRSVISYKTKDSVKVGAKTSTKSRAWHVTRTFKTGQKFDAATIEKQIVGYVNIERKKAHLKPLKTSAVDTKVARTWSSTMARTGNYEHMYDWSWLKKVHARFGGENIHHIDAVDGDDLAWTAVDDWMFSEGHRENILDRHFTSIGVGVVKAKDGSFYLTQEFHG